MTVSVPDNFSDAVRALPKRLAFVPRALRIAWAAAPASTSAWAALLVLRGILPAASVYLVKVLVDGLLVAVAAGGVWPSVRPVVSGGALLGCVLVLQEIAGNVLQWVRVAQSERVGDHLRALVQRKATEVDFSFYESPHYFDRLSRVIGEANSRPLLLLESIGGLIQSTITLVAMGALLVPYGWWVPVVLVVSVVPVLVVIVRHSRRYHAWWERRTEDRRRAQYADTLLTHPATAGEVRLFGLGPSFQRTYARYRATLRGERLALEREQVAGRLGAGIVSLLVVGGVMAWMGWRVVRGPLTVGDLALFYQAFNRGKGLAGGLLANVGQVYESGLFLEHLFGFLDQRAQVVSPAAPHPIRGALEGGIHLRDVTFRYPGGEHAVLQNFDLFIPAGRTVAIVGANGAGKSTVLKLIARFYDVEAGAVTFDGVDVRAFDLDAHWRRTTALFQFPVNYYVTVAEAITMGDVAGGDDRARMEEAARVAGIHERIGRLANGYEAQLGKWFTGGRSSAGASGSA